MHPALPAPSPILHIFCLNFLREFVVPREIEDNAYAKFLGANRGVLWKICKLEMNVF